MSINQDLLRLEYEMQEAAIEHADDPEEYEWVMEHLKAEEEMLLEELAERCANRGNYEP